VVTAAPQPVRSTDSSTTDAPLVFVTVGGDHHPFARLLAWVDRWLADGADTRIRCVVQHGPLDCPSHAAGSAYLEHEQLLALLSEAHVVISSGGPATLIEARRQGHVPIAVPRRSGLGEHVDDHQIAFVERLAKAGRAVVVHTEQDFRRAVEAALEAPPRPISGDAPGTHADERTVRSIGGIVDATATRSRTWRRRPPDPVAVTGSRRAH
jgi:UDP-N-acetylglucosamine transferase subunit ALG13